MTSSGPARQARADPRGPERTGQRRRRDQRCAHPRGAADDTRLALEAKACVLVMSHLGRPEEGKFSEEFSLAPVAKRSPSCSAFPVPLKRDWLDGVSVAPGEVVLLENVRFNKGEKKDSDELSKKMAALCDIYVMDAFGTAHRAEASTHGVAKYAPVACAGPLLVSELTALETALEKPAAAAARHRGRLEGVDQAHGARVAALKVDQLIVGGGITNTFLAALGFNVSASRCTSRHARYLQAPDRSVAKARHRDPDADRRGRRQGVLAQGRGRRQARRQVADTR
jgi:phosphoglycerate kinase